MKCSKITIIILLFLLSTFGCSTLKHGQHIASIDMPTDAIPELSDVQTLSDTKRTAMISANTRLAQAAIELNLTKSQQLRKVGIDTNLVTSSASLVEPRPHHSLFPTWLRNSEVAKKIVADQIIDTPDVHFLLSRTSGKPATAKKHNYSAKELSNFSLTLLKRSGFFGEYIKDDNMSTLISLNSTTDQKPSMYDYRLVYYLAAYFEGEYVDRDGPLTATQNLPPMAT